MWPWCNLAAHQRRSYCTSMNNRSPVGLVSRQWDAGDWVCLLCDHRISQISSLSKAILASGKARSRMEPNLGCGGGGGWQTWAMWCFAKKKSLHESCRMGRRIVAMKVISSLGHCECDGHTVHKLSQRRLTADWLAPRKSDCSWMYSKISSDGLPSFIKATWPAVEIFKMVAYFPDSPRTVVEKQ